MPNTFVYPTALELKQIEQNLLPMIEEGRVGLDLLPVVVEDVWKIRWEQEDDFFGLQQVRGLNGEPNRVRRVGAKGYEQEPGAYGEFSAIHEKELTERRQLGSLDQPIDISGLVRRIQEHLMVREKDRVELIVWTLLTTGTFSVANHLGILHTDTFPIRTSTPSTAWSTAATSTPVADLRSILLTHGRGQSANFGRAARLYVNKKKVQQILANTNAADLGGYTQNSDRLVTMDDVNRVLIAQDLPVIVEYDGGYVSDAGTWTPFIPDTKGVLIGPRTNGAAIGEYRMVRNANNPSLAPGSYDKVIDRGEDHVPRTIEVHRGHNGGPVLYFPGSVVALTI